MWLPGPAFRDVGFRVVTRAEGFGVRGLGFRVSGLGFRGLGLGVLRGFTVEVFEARAANCSASRLVVHEDRSPPNLSWNPIRFRV